MVRLTLQILAVLIMALVLFVGCGEENASAHDRGKDTLMISEKPITGGYWDLEQICAERGHVWGTAYIHQFHASPYKVIDGPDTSYEFAMYKAERIETTCERCQASREVWREYGRIKVIWVRP